jgi:hypothetical protein
MKLGRKIRRATNAQPTLGDRSGLLFRNVVSVYLDVFEARQMRSENTADRATTNDANLDLHAVFISSAPE